MNPNALRVGVALLKGLIVVRRTVVGLFYLKAYFTPIIIDASL